MCVQDFVGVEGRVSVLKETVKTTGLEFLRFVWYGKGTGSFLSSLLLSSPMCF